jgi:hypothetical protein
MIYYMRISRIVKCQNKTTIVNGQAPEGAINAWQRITPRYYLTFIAGRIQSKINGDDART